MSATDELRRLLDERGVEWTGGHYTDWDDANGHPAEAFEFDGTLYVSCVLTPAQAVEATLGRGTCHITVEDNLAETEGMGDVWLECSACHWQMPLEPTTPLFGYCPNCGRKVVEV